MILSQLYSSCFNFHFLFFSDSYQFFFLNSYRLHVIDLDPSSVTSGGWLEDTSLVEKYTISDEAYGKRDGKCGKNFIWQRLGVRSLQLISQYNCFYPFSVPVIST